MQLDYGAESREQQLMEEATLRANCKLPKMIILAS